MTDAPRRRPTKNSQLTMRITQASREALDAEAAASGRSISEVAEGWINEARVGRASAEALLGGASVAPAIRQLVGFARMVEERIGDPSLDPHARGVLINGWRLLMLHLVPVPGLTELEFRYITAATELRAATAELQDAIQALPPEERSPELEAVRLKCEIIGQQRGDIDAELAAYSLWQEVAETSRHWPAALNPALGPFLSIGHRFQAELDRRAAVMARDREVGQQLAKAWLRPPVSDPE